MKNNDSARLRHARESAGFTTAAEAARRFGWKEPTYHSHENSSRGFPKGKAVTYAKAFKVDVEWLLTGRGEMKGDARVPLKGYIGAGGMVFPIDDHAIGEGLDRVEAPPEMGPNTVAVKVRGDSMQPAYFDGDLLFYEDHEVVPEDAVGRECILETGDGRMMLKVLLRGSRKNRFNLVSYNAPPIMDVALRWAARVTWVKRAK